MMDNIIKRDFICDIKQEEIILEDVRIDSSCDIIQDASKPENIDIKPEIDNEKHVTLEPIAFISVNNEIKQEIFENFDIHMKTVHEGRSDHKSDLCEKSFAHPKMKTNYEDKRDHKCDHCPVYTSFFYYADLKKHIKAVHEGNKDYKCDHCGKSFALSHHLKNHIKGVHEGQKDHKCNLCEKSFFLFDYLKTHIKTVHEGQRYYKCDICGKFFSRSGSLKRHIKNIHEGQKRDT